MKRYLSPFALAISFFSMAPTASAQDEQLFFGLLHAHTFLSDGRGTPDEAFTMAAQYVDFFALTEHNHKDAAGDDGIFLIDSGYDELKAAAAEHSVDGEFVAIFGQEVSSISRGNHVNVFNSDTIVDIENGDFRDLYERYLPDHPEVPFIQLNHPDIRKDLNFQTSRKKRNNDYGIDDYNQSYTELVAASGAYVRLIELIVGPAFNNGTSFQHRDGRHQNDYLFYLNQGFKLAPSVGQDNHFKNWGTSTEARLGLWAKELTKESVFDALSSGQTYASEDRNLAVGYKFGDTLLGGTVRIGDNENGELELSLVDPDEPNADYKAALFHDPAIGGDTAAIVDVVEVSGDATVTFPITPTPGSYFFLKITQTSDEEVDPDDVWTAPIWFAAAEDTEEDEEHTLEGVIAWSDAHDYVGQEMTIGGRVVDSYLNSEALFLNFDPNYQDTLTVVIFSSAFDAFGGAEDFRDGILGKEVLVTGEISTYRDRIQTIVSEPSAISIQ